MLCLAAASLWHHKLEILRLDVSQTLQALDLNDQSGTLFVEIHNSTVHPVEKFIAEPTENHT